MRKSIRFIGNFLFVILLCALLFSYAMFQGGFVSWFLFFSFLPIFLYQIGLLCYPIRHWQVTRTLSNPVISAGDRAAVTIHIQRKFPFPLYYCVFEEVFPQTLRKIDNGSDKYHYLGEPSKLHSNRQVKKIVFPWFRRTIEIPYELKHIPRGEHQLSAIRMRTADMFGFIKKEHIFHIANELNVYPNHRAIQINGQINSMEQGSTSSHSFHLKNTNVVSGIREYAPGDKISWIDWKQTARNQTMMTKEFEQEKSTDILCILDGCNHEHLNPLAFEGAVEVSLALVEEMAKQASRVEFLSIGADVLPFSFDSHSAKREAIRQHLTRIQPRGKDSFAEQLLACMKINHYTSMIIVTTHLDESLRKVIQKMNERSKRITIIFIQSKSSLSSIEQNLIQQFEYEGTTICVLTEKELVNSPIEVRI